MKKEIKEAMALASIREIVGDGEGRLMQAELVQRVRNLREAENQLRDGVIEFIANCGDYTEEVDRLKFLLDQTQWWDWDETENSEEETP